MWIQYRSKWAWGKSEWQIMEVRWELNLRKSSHRESVERLAIRHGFISDDFETFRGIEIKELKTLPVDIIESQIKRHLNEVERLAKQLKRGKP